MIRNIERLKKEFDRWEISSPIPLSGMGENKWIMEIAIGPLNKFIVVPNSADSFNIFSSDGKLEKSVQRIDGVAFKCVYSLKINSSKDFFTLTDLGNKRLLLLSADDYSIKATYSFQDAESNPFQSAVNYISSEDIIYLIAKTQDTMTLYTFDRSLKLLEERVIKDSNVSTIGYFCYCSKLDVFFIVDFSENKIYKLESGSLEKIFETDLYQLGKIDYYGGYLYISVRWSSSENIFLKLSLQGDLVYVYKNQAIKIVNGFYVDNDRLIIGSKHRDNVWTLVRK